MDNKLKEKKFYITKIEKKKIEHFIKRIRNDNKSFEFKLFDFLFRRFTYLEIWQDTVRAIFCEYEFIFIRGDIKNNTKEIRRLFKIIKDKKGIFKK